MLLANPSENVLNSSLYCHSGELSYLNDSSPLSMVYSMKSQTILASSHCVPRQLWLTSELTTQR